MPLTLAEQVAKQVATVRKARTDAIAELTGGWYTSDTDKMNADAIKALIGTIDGWAKRGTDAAKANKAPGSGGWPGWTKAGEDILGGIQDISDAADGETLAAIIETVTKAPDHIGEDLEKAGRKVGKAVGTVAAAAGETVAAAAFPLMPVLLGLAAVAAVVFVGSRKLAP